MRGPRRSRSWSATSQEDSRRIDVLPKKTPVVPNVSIQSENCELDTRFLRHRKENFQAGAVSRCLEKWVSITTDQWILKLIEGYQIDFREKPYKDF